MNAEETAMRLQEAAAKCLSSLDAWNKDLKNVDAREALLEAVHELRKVTSRLEIDIAMNDRKVTNAKPLPIPEHKSKTEKKSQKPLSEILPVAEIKETRKRRKIEIESSNDDQDDIEDQIDTEDDNGDNEKPKKTEKRPTRPRRKKRDSSEQSTD
tara:strand:+ start:94 stop:558 length:465 start_codon:yes stop_codon:yes gene_type:complete